MQHFKMVCIVTFKLQIVSNCFAVGWRTVNTYFLVQENVSYSGVIECPPEKMLYLLVVLGETLTLVSQWSKLHMACSDFYLYGRRLRSNVKRYFVQSTTFMLYLNSSFLFH